MINLSEGNWAFPATVKAAKQLGDLMAKPLPGKGADKKLYSLFGDDSLFAMLDDAADSDQADVRWAVKARLKKYLAMKPTELKLPDDVRRELTKLVESDESITEGKITFKQFLMLEEHEVYPWAKEMATTAGIKGKLGPDMSDTGDGRFISKRAADAGLAALKDAGYKVNSKDGWVTVPDKSDSKRGMTFEYDDDSQVAVRFFDDNQQQ